jgi:hypothetical protein
MGKPAKVLAIRRHGEAYRWFRPLPERWRAALRAYRAPHWTAAALADKRGRLALRLLAADACTRHQVLSLNLREQLWVIVRLDIRDGAGRRTRQRREYEMAHAAVQAFGADWTRAALREKAGNLALRLLALNECTDQDLLFASTRAALWAVARTHIPEWKKRRLSGPRRSRTSCARASRIECVTPPSRHDEQACLAGTQMEVRRALNWRSPG